MRKNTFTVKVSIVTDKVEIQTIKDATTIFSNLGGFLINTLTDSFQFDGDCIISIDGSDDYNKC
jgi:hypothetical protein